MIIKTVKLLKLPKQIVTLPKDFQLIQLGSIQGEPHIWIRTTGIVRNWDSQVHCFEKEYDIPDTFDPDLVLDDLYQQWRYLGLWQSGTRTLHYFQKPWVLLPLPTPTALGN